MATVEAIYRYPVKGLSGENLATVTMTEGQSLPYDRVYAVARGKSGIDQNNPVWAGKANFLQLMRIEKLATLETVFDDETDVLTIKRQGRQVSRGKLNDQMGRTLIEQFFAAYLKDELRTPPKLVKAAGQAFSDTDKPFVSFINLASVKDIERVIPRPIDPMRFRGNILVNDLPAWQEFDWVGSKIKVGTAVFKVEERIGRCAATNVDPKSGERDMTIPRDLVRGFQHSDCGVYATCIEGGEIKPGDGISLI